LITILTSLDLNFIHVWRSGGGAQQQALQPRFFDASVKKFGQVKGIWKGYVTS